MKIMTLKRVPKEVKNEVERTFEEIKKHYVSKTYYDIKCRALEKTREELKLQRFMVINTWKNLRALGFNDKKFKENNIKLYNERYK
jgi:adenylate cyclase class IV